MASNKLAQIREKISVVAVKVLQGLCLVLSGMFCISMLGLALSDDPQFGIFGFMVIFGMTVLFGWIAFKLSRWKPKLITNKDTDSRYLSLILNQGHTDIETIATLVQKSCNARFAKFVG